MSVSESEPLGGSWSGGQLMGGSWSGGKLMGGNWDGCSHDPQQFANEWGTF